MKEEAMGNKLTCANPKAYCKSLPVLQLHAQQLINIVVLFDHFLFSSYQKYYAKTYEP